MDRNAFTILSVVVGLLLCASVSHAQMTSSNYMIRWDSFSTGGSDSSSSASYNLVDSVDQSAGAGSSASYQIESGYRAGVFDQVIAFEPMAQNNIGRMTASSVATNTVAVDSTAGLSQGDYIVLIQDEGASQVSAMGRISSFDATNITVDAWNFGSGAPTIDGVNDYAYPLNSNSVVLGELDESTVSTAIIGFETTIDDSNGYTVAIIEDGDFRAGGSEIDDVLDGTVTAGAEEYGARSSDTTIPTSSFDTADTAISSDFQSVAYVPTGVFQSRYFVTVKAGISGLTESGSYSHVISFIASGNF